MYLSLGPARLLFWVTGDCFVEMSVGREGRQGRAGLMLGITGCLGFAFFWLRAEENLLFQIVSRKGAKLPAKKVKSTTYYNSSNWLGKEVLILITQFRLISNTFRRNKTSILLITIVVYLRIVRGLWTDFSYRPAGCEDEQNVCGPCGWKSGQDFSRWRLIWIVFNCHEVPIEEYLRK